MTARSILGWMLALSLCISARAQDAASLQGRVMETDSERPLAGANVVLRRDGEQIAGTTTNEAGRFVFEDLAPGPAMLGVRFLGFQPFEQRVQLRADQVNRMRIALEGAAVELSAIEIIGDSREEQRALPGAATALKPRAINMISPVGTQELLTYVPGVHGFADDGFGNSRLSIGIRGLNPRRSSRVLFLEDGIPIQPALYVYPNMYYNPPAERIDRVEVIKGSAAVRHGPQTMGGVVNYITSRPHRDPGLSGQLTAGANGYVSLFAETGGWQTGTITPEVQLLFKRGDGFRRNNSFRQYNGTAKLSIVPGAKRSIYVKANVNYENSEATYTGLTPYTFQHNPTFNPKEDDTFQVFRGALDVIYNREHASRLSSTTRAYVNYFDRDWWHERDVFVRPGAYSPGDSAAPDPVPWYTNGDLVRVGGERSTYGVLRTFYVGGLQRSYAFDHLLFGQQAHLDAGARLHFERFLDNRREGDDPTEHEGVFYRGNPDEPETLDIVGQSHHYETTALAAWASEEVTIGDLRLTPGLRMEWFEQEQIDRLNGSTYIDATNFVLLPGLGFNYQIGRYNLFGGIHRGYTPPSSGTIKISNLRAAQATSGLDLRPEKSWNTELGLRGRLPWLGFEATAFHLYIEDLVAAARGAAFTNLGTVQTYGLELGGTLRAQKLLHLLPAVNLSYTYLQTDVLAGRLPSAVSAGNVVSVADNELPYAPRHKLTLGIARRIGPLRLRADWRFVDRSFTDFENLTFTTNRGDTGPIPAYAYLNASARYQIADRLSAQLVAKNVTDEVYIGSRLHSNPGQPEADLSSGILPGPRRQINLTLRYGF